MSYMLVFHLSNVAILIKWFTKTEQKKILVALVVLALTNLV
jgi:hypothetical protein